VWLYSKRILHKGCYKTTKLAHKTMKWWASLSILSTMQLHVYFSKHVYLSLVFWV